MMESQTAPVACNVDRPTSGDVVPARGLTISGWAFREDRSPLLGVRAIWAEATVGETHVNYLRDDVNGIYALGDDVRAGFSVYVDALPLDQEMEIALVADFGDGEEPLGTIDVRTSAFDPAAEHYGALDDPGFAVVLHRDDIYSIGPPSPVANEECVNRIVALTVPEDAILDVGCGIGAYAEPLVAAGRSWHGCEVVGSFVDAIRARGLAVTQASGTTLPFEDGSFDIAIGVEVLEHIDDYASFVAEMARVSRRGAILSVPNAGAIPRYAPLGIVPWHLLEGSHVNFFTVASLRALLSESFASVEVFEYGALPLPTVDGTVVHNHLFATAFHGEDGPG